MSLFLSTRAAALSRLAAFAPHTGRHYAADRNTDTGPGPRIGVSMLSPYLRFRMISEEEVLAATAERFSFIAAEKFIQEVVWRAYFKGYLEARPSIWRSYLRDVETLPRSKFYQHAVTGQIGIDCFDFWVNELTTTGYLHNHARMWFASIWIFTLRLPWQLGADFMYRHLIDGDPASNTLSWRWVGGLHTVGKTYLARPDNIDRYTNGRFNPRGLATFAEPLMEQTEHRILPLPPVQNDWPQQDHGLLITTEDLLPLHGPFPKAVAIPVNPTEKAGGTESHLARHFKTQALDDFTSRCQHPHSRIDSLTPDAIIRWCENENISIVAVSAPPLGPESDAVDNIAIALNKTGRSLSRVRRRYDALTWPHCTKGFFALKAKIPDLLEKLGLPGQQTELF